MLVLFFSIEFDSYTSYHADLPSGVCFIVLVTPHLTVTLVPLSSQPILDKIVQNISTHNKKKYINKRVK